MDGPALAAIAGTSNTVLRDLGPDIQWVQSYVSDDKITCVYVAADEELIREHGRCGGFPVGVVHEVRAISTDDCGAGVVNRAAISSLTMRVLSFGGTPEHTSGTSTFAGASAIMRTRLLG